MPLVGCFNQEKIDVITFQPSNYQVHFYSNKTGSVSNDAYLRAILSYKVSYQEELKITRRKKTESDEKFLQSVTSFPALVITYEGQEVITVSGDKSEDDILNNIKKTINNKHEK